MFPDTRGDGETVLRQSQLVMLRILKIVDYICRKHNIKYWLDGGTLLGAIRHDGFIPWDDDIDIVMPREDYIRFIDVAGKELPEDLFLQSQETDIFYDMPWIKVRDNKSKIIEYKVGNYHNGMFIDIFPMDTYGGNQCKIKRRKKEFKLLYKTLILVKEPFESISSKKILIKNVVKGSLKTILFPYTLMSREKVFKRLEYIKKRLGSSSLDEEGEFLGYGMDVIFWNLFIDKKTIYPLKLHKFEDGEFFVPNDWDGYLTQLFGDYMKLPQEEERIPHNLGLVPILTVEEKESLSL